MRIPDGSHTHGSGGSGLGTALLVLAGAALTVELAGPVMAVAELVWVLGIVVTVIAGGAAVALMGGWAWRRRRRRLGAALLTRIPVRAAPPIPHPQPAIERPPDGHYHFHVSAEEMAAIVRQQQESE